MGLHAANLGHLCHLWWAVGRGRMPEGIWTTDWSDEIPNLKPLPAYRLNNPRLGVIELQWPKKRCLELTRVSVTNPKIAVLYSSNIL